MLSTLWAQGRTGQTPPAEPSWIAAMFPFILIFVVFYFIVIRPQRKQQKQLEQMRKELKKGDRVVTIGGIIGTVAQVKDQSVVLKVSDNTRIEFRKSAIAYRFSDKEKQVPEGEVQALEG